MAEARNKAAKGDATEQLDSLAGDEGDELGDALLQGFLGVLGNLAVSRDGLLHDAADVGDGQEPVLLPDAAVPASSATAAVVAPAARGARRRVRHPVLLHHSRDGGPRSVSSPQQTLAPIFQKSRDGFGERDAYLI